MEYSTFNKALLELREEYHRNGTIDDSNKKLDEMIKLLTMNFYDAKKGTNNFNISSLEEASRRKYGTIAKKFSNERFIIMDPTCGGGSF